MEVGKKYKFDGKYSATISATIVEVLFKTDKTVLVRSTAGHEFTITSDWWDTYKEHVPKKSGTAWVGIYPYVPTAGKTGCYPEVYPTKEQVYTNNNRIKPIAIIEVPWEEGQGLS